MAQIPRQLTPHASALHYFGAELRRRRQHLGWSQAELAARVHVSSDLIGKIEKAVRWPTADLAALCDQAMETDGALAKLATMVELERSRIKRAPPHPVGVAEQAPAQPRWTSHADRPLGSAQPPSQGSLAELLCTLLPGATAMPALAPVPTMWNADLLVTLPCGAAIGSSTVAVLTPPMVGATVDQVHVSAVRQPGTPPPGVHRFAIALQRPGPGDPARGWAGTFIAAEARPGRTVTAIPRAYALDELTAGILWAVCGMDDALLGDDAALADSVSTLRPYAALPGSAASREVAGELTELSRGWLGSDFCSRHIARSLLRNPGDVPDQPIFWTREQRGEEAATWLLFRHKYDYLRATTARFTSHHAPIARVFCVPEDAVAGSPLAERILFLLSGALMEALGIQIHVCTDPAYAGVEGFVLIPSQRVVIANWVRGDGLWHVDTVDARPALREHADVVGHGCAHSILTEGDPGRRLAALAGYLDIDWTWVCRRAGELAVAGIDGLVRPRSRLLSTRGVQDACWHLGLLAPCARRPTGSAK